MGERTGLPESPDSPLKAVLFDLDGTLIDSEPLAARAAEEILARFSQKLTQEEVAWMVGRSWRAIYEGVYAPRQLPLNEEEFTAEVNQIYRRLIGESCPVLPGAVTSVRWLADRFPLAIVSGSNREEIEFILKAIDLRQHFGLIISNADYRLSKPSPDPYLSALRKINQPPEACLAIEDSAAGIASARGAGLKVVAISAANHTGADLGDADLVLPYLSRLDDRHLRDLFGG
jgi:beta-phosphoglucomutase